MSGSRPYRYELIFAAERGEETELQLFSGSGFRIFGVEGGGAGGHQERRRA